MGAKAWFIAYFDDDPKAVLGQAPTLDIDASRQLAERLFPDANLDELEPGTLDLLNPERRQVFVGDYGGLRIVAHDELSGDYPSRVKARWLDPDLGQTAYLHATHSVVDWFAYGQWRQGTLVRALSVSPDGGVQEQIGDPLPFEQPFWDGEADEDGFDTDDDMEMDDAELIPFHPLDMSDAALLVHLGFQFEGHPQDWVCDPMEIPIARFSIKRNRPFWKVW
ncbi:MAG: hypothetical protein AAGA71_13845 [Pseudomonadota bacterium]